MQSAYATRSPETCFFCTYLPLQLPSYTCSRSDTLRKLHQSRYYALLTPCFSRAHRKSYLDSKSYVPTEKKRKEKYGSNLEGLMRSSHEDTYFIILSRSNGSYNNSRVLAFSWFLHTLRVEFEVSYRKLNSLMQNVRDISQNKTQMFDQLKICLQILTRATSQVLEMRFLLQMTRRCYLTICITRKDPQLGYYTPLR